MKLATRWSTAVKLALSSALAASLLAVTSADATLGSRNETPANCGSPCYTVIYKTYSPTSKWARAEWIASGGGSEGGSRCGGVGSVAAGSALSSWCSSS